jgi:hypothetical protein
MSSWPVTKSVAEVDPEVDPDGALLFDVVVAYI